MKRVITSFKNANKDLLKAITDEFPKGVDDDALVNFPKAGGGSIRALEIIMDDCMYLVKMENQEYFQKYLAAEDDEDDDTDDDLDDDLEDDMDDAEELELDEED